MGDIGESQEQLQLAESRSTVTPAPRSNAGSKTGTPQRSRVGSRAGSRAGSRMGSPRGGADQAALSLSNLDSATNASGTPKRPSSGTPKLATTKKVEAAAELQIGDIVRMAGLPALLEFRGNTGAVVGPVRVDARGTSHVDVYTIDGRRLDVHTRFLTLVHRDPSAAASIGTPGSAGVARGGPATANRPASASSSLFTDPLRPYVAHHACGASNKSTLLSMHGESRRGSIATSTPQARQQAPQAEAAAPESSSARCLQQASKHCERGGEHGHAVILMQRAIGAARALRGDAHACVLRMRTDLGRLQLRSRNFAAAEQTLIATKEAADRERGAESIESAACMRFLTEALLGQGELERAAELARRTLHVTTALLAKAGRPVPGVQVLLDLPASRGPRIRLAC